MKIKQGRDMGLRFKCVVLVFDQPFVAANVWKDRKRF